MTDNLVNPGKSKEAVDAIYELLRHAGYLPQDTFEFTTTPITPVLKKAKKPRAKKQPETVDFYDQALRKIEL